MNKSKQNEPKDDCHCGAFCLEHTAATGRVCKLEKHRTEKSGCGNGHDWDAGGSWGVIIGVSKCKRCERVSRSSDFSRA